MEWLDRMVGEVERCGKGKALFWATAVFAVWEGAWLEALLAVRI